MLILSIESSCDETAAAVITGNRNSKKVKLLSSVVASSLSLHKQTGGIIPESAAREQIKFIIPVIQDALSIANLTPNDIDTIAVTFGPGLVGSLLVGVETAKTFSYVWNKPLIPTNHLLGHIYANFIEPQTANGLPTTAIDTSLSALSLDIEFPALSLIVSGGHTDLVLIKNHGDIKWLGGTLDDAAGEALDKIGRLLGLPYPGGPFIEISAAKGDPDKYNFPSPMMYSKDLNFSFSGLKAAVAREVMKIKKLDEQTVNDICAATQKAIIDVLVFKTVTAAKKYKVKSILLGGGVAANQTLRNKLQSSIVNSKLSIKFFVPPKNLCTDNAAMIGATAFFNNKTVPWQKLNANPNLYFDQP